MLVTLPPLLSALSHHWAQKMSLALSPELFHSALAKREGDYSTGIVESASDVSRSSLWNCMLETLLSLTGEESGLFHGGTSWDDTYSRRSFSAVCASINSLFSGTVPVNYGEVKS